MAQKPKDMPTCPYPEEARKQLGLRDGFTVGYSGHFYPGRGMELLTEIARLLPEVNFLWMGGRQEDIAPWQETLAEQSIHNVTITGFIPNSRLPLYQAAADVLVMPYGKKISGSSGGDISRVINPMKMFDYLAAGRPIIASEIPVFHEILTKETAIFCEPENAQDWAKAIQDLQDNPEKRAQMGASAKASRGKIYLEKPRPDYSGKTQKAIRIIRDDQKNCTLALDFNSSPRCLSGVQLRFSIPALTRYRIYYCLHPDRALLVFA